MSNAADPGPVLDNSLPSLAEDESSAQVRTQTAPDKATRRETVDASSEPEPTGALASPTLTIEPQPEDGQWVQVLFGTTKEPIPLAIVTVHPPQLVNKKTRLVWKASGRDRTERLLVPGRQYQANDEGMVLIPFPSDGTSISCNFEELRGWHTFYLYQLVELEKLRLFHDAPYSARVISSESGMPVANVPVAVRHSTALNDSSKLAIKQTNEQGEVQFTNTRQYSDWYWKHAEELALAIVGIYETDIKVRFEPDAFEPIELVLPPSTEFEVVLFDLDGELYLDQALVSLDLDGELAFEDEGRAAALMTEDARAIFRHVGTDLDLLIKVQPLEGHTVEKVKVRSAAAPGARTSVEIQVGQPGPLVSGRMIGIDGAPCASTSMSVTFRKSDKNGFDFISRQVTDSGGRFRVLAPNFFAGDSSSEIEFKVNSTEARPVAAVVQISEPLPMGELELGDVQLTELPLLVGGHVVDQNGTPIKGASLRIHRTKIEIGRGREISTVFSDKSGKFVCYGIESAATIKIDARHSRYKDQFEREVVLGTGGVEFVLEAAGRITGNVLVDEEWLLDFVSVSARVNPDDDNSAYSNTERSGAFQLESLSSGDWIVSVGTEDDAEHGINAVEIHNVAVSAGQTTVDPRLQAIDLRGKINVFSFEIVDLDGARIEDSHMQYRESGQVEWKVVDWIINGEAHLITRSDEIDVHAAAWEYSSELALNVRKGRRLELRPALQVRLIWDAGSAPKGEREYVYHAFLSKETSDLSVSSEWGSIGSREEPSDPIALSSAGEYTLGLSILDDDPEKTLSFTSIDFAKVTVLDVSGVQEFVVFATDELRQFIRDETQ